MLPLRNNFKTATKIYQNNAEEQQKENDIIVFNENNILKLQ